MNTFDRAKPYNNIPLLPPQIEIETKSMLTKTIQASGALAQLKWSYKKPP